MPGQRNQSASRSAAFFDNGLEPKKKPAAECSDAGPFRLPLTGYVIVDRPDLSAGMSGDLSAPGGAAWGAQGG
jgi:hypothetical protein